MLVNVPDCEPFMASLISGRVHSISSIYQLFRIFTSP